MSILGVLKPGTEIAGCYVISVVSEKEIILRCNGLPGRPCDSTFAESQDTIKGYSLHRKILTCDSCRVKESGKGVVGCSYCGLNHPIRPTVYMPSKIPESEAGKSGVIMMQGGCSDRSVSKKLGVTRQTILNWRLKWITVPVLLAWIAELERQLADANSPPCRVPLPGPGEFPVGTLSELGRAILEPQTGNENNGHK